MTRILLVALSALIASAAMADAPTYSLDTSGSTKELKAGKDGTFALAIKPAKGFHVNAEAPLKITLTGERVKPAKDALGHADAADPKAESRSFKVALKSTEAGKGSITADATFVICSETICEKKTEKVTLALDVKP
jgi:hypothetical protein